MIHELHPLRHADMPVVGVGGGYGGDGRCPARLMYSRTTPASRGWRHHISWSAPARISHTADIARTRSTAGHGARRAFCDALKSSHAGCAMFAGSRGDRATGTGCSTRYGGGLIPLKPPIGLFAADDARTPRARGVQALGTARPNGRGRRGRRQRPSHVLFANPPLSSVIQDAEGVGWEAAKILDMMLRGQRRPRAAPSCRSDSRRALHRRFPSGRPADRSGGHVHPQPRHGPHPGQ